MAAAASCNAGSMTSYWLTSGDVNWLIARRHESTLSSLSEPVEINVIIEFKTPRVSWAATESVTSKCFDYATIIWQSSPVRYTNPDSLQKLDCVPQRFEILQKPLETFQIGRAS